MRTYEAEPAASASAAAGIATFNVNDPGGPGVVLVMGFNGTAWQEFLSFQNTVPEPDRLPARIWICADQAPSVVRSGPGDEYEVVGEVPRDTEVEASFFVLAEALKPGQRAGLGWFRVRGEGVDGWAASSTVAGPEPADCGLWRAYRSAP